MLSTTKQEWQASLDVVEQALLLDPKHEEARLQKSKMLAELQQWEKCYEYIKETMLDYPNNETLIGLRETVLDQLPPEFRQRDAPQSFVVDEDDLDKAK
jgi:tetratricopeptide (TPR) repeat protein